MELDLVRGQLVSMYGYNCIVRYVNDRDQIAVLEYPNGERKTHSFQKIAEENDWLEIEEDYPDYW